MSYLEGKRSDEGSEIRRKRNETQRTSDVKIPLYG